MFSPFYVCLASGGEACETAYGYFYAICLMQLPSVLQCPAITESALSQESPLFLFSQNLQKESLMNISSELVAAELQFAL